MDNTQKPRGALLWIALILSVFNAMFFFSMRHIWSGVHDMFGLAALPVLMMVVLVLVALATALAFAKRKAALAALIVNGVLFAALMYMLSLGFGSIPYILREFGLLALGMAGVGALALLIWRFPLKGRQRKALKAAVILLVCLVAFCAAYDIAPGGFKTGPAVFAVGDRYQIIFTTRADAVAWVEVGGVLYYDTYNGSSRSETTVHKIEVPMTALDRHESYTIGARTMIFRGPYDGIYGRSYSQTVAFRPVDESDGLQYYFISDSHDYTQAASQAAGYFGDDLDFLILGGDHASYITHEADLTRALVIAHSVTGGGRPVIYARGNHEVKGNRADELHRYVGADGDRFYYTFRLGSVWGVVLDVGEDHADDWWEFYGTAHYDAYRADQTEFLRDINAHADDHYAAAGVTTRLAICHYPINFMRADDYLSGVKNAWVAQLNQMELTLMLSGHMHRIFWTTPDMPNGMPLVYADNDYVLGETYGLAFPAVVCCQQNDVQFPVSRGTYLGQAMIGAAIETKNGNTVLWFTNSDQQVIDLVDPWSGGPIPQPVPF